MHGSLPKIDFNLLNSGPSKSPQIVSNGSFGLIIGIWVTVGSGTFALSRDFSKKKFKNDNFKSYKILKISSRPIKEGCVVAMVVVSIPTHAEFGPNEHREDAAREDAV